jgi:hypothetical protein
LTAIVKSEQSGEGWKNHAREMRLPCTVLIFYKEHLLQITYVIKLFEGCDSILFSHDILAK